MADRGGLWVKVRLRFLLLTLLLFAAGGEMAICQQNTSVTGRIVSNRLPVEYATVTAYNTVDTTRMITAVITDSSGFFTFEGLSFGSYVLKITVQGYQQQKTLFTIDTAHSTLSL